MYKEQRDAQTQNKLDAIEDIAEESRLTVLNQVKQLEQLETEFGLDQDVFTDVYGAILRSNQTESIRKLLENYSVVYNAINQPGTIAAIINTENVLRDGCYGFGQPAVYDVKIHGCIIDEPAELIYTKDGPAALGLGGSTGKISLAGSGLYEFHGSSEPKSVEKLQIATETDDSFNYTEGPFVPKKRMLDSESIILVGNIENHDLHSQLTLLSQRLSRQDPFLLNGLSRFYEEKYIYKKTVQRA